MIQLRWMEMKGTSVPKITNLALLLLKKDSITRDAKCHIAAEKLRKSELKVKAVVQAIKSNQVSCIVANSPTTQPCAHRSKKCKKNKELV